jgi:predicted KAP-like P-loop ATPase
MRANMLDNVKLLGGLFFRRKGNEMISSDKPITSLQDDLLGRASFVKKLGKTICDWDNEESTVLALFGPWGSGKTSLLNMTIEHIENFTEDWEKERKPIIIQFNPWNYSEQNTLLQAFFQHLISSVNKNVPIHKRDYKNRITNLATALESLEFIPKAGKIISALGKFIKTLFPPDSIENLKDKVSNYLTSLDRRIIIILDDIDRLTKKEIRQLFQLIKINADFPNTIYILAFERNIVEEALRLEQGQSGRAYMEKIVQVGFDLPEVHISYIHKFLTTQLDLALKPLEEDRFDNRYWGNIFHAGLKTFFSTLRDVKRFISSFSFAYDTVIDEVNPVDFICIEALRVFVPEVYQTISENKELFTQETSYLYNTNQADKGKEILEEIFRKAGEHLEATRDICKLLFPVLKVPFSGGMSDNSWYEKRRKDRRICVPDMFDYYFLLDTPPGVISRVELLQVVDKCEKPDELESMIDKFTEDEKIGSFLDHIDDISSQLNLAQAKGLIRALLPLSGELKNFEQGIFSLASDFKIAWAIFKLLEKVPEGERCEWFAQQIPTIHSIYSIIYIIVQDEPQEGKERAVQLFSAECIVQLKKIVVERLNELAAKNLLLQQKRLLLVLLNWKKWSEDIKHIEDFVDKARNDRKLAIRLLTGFLYEVRSHSFGEYVTSTNQELNFEGLSEFLDPDILVQHIISMSEEEIMELPSDQLVAVKALLKISEENIKNSGEI